MIYTLHTSNASALNAAISLHLPNGGLALDCTYGLGNFWSSRPQGIKLVRMDRFKINHSRVQGSATRQPFAAGIFDLVVLDPPYQYNPRQTARISGGRLREDFDFGIMSSQDMSTNAKVLDLYWLMLSDAARTVKANGYIIAKCQDMAESSRNRWNHVSVLNMAVELGLTPRDMLVIASPGSGGLRAWNHTDDNQKLARKKHGYMWVFKSCPQKAGRNRWEVMG